MVDKKFAIVTTFLILINVTDAELNINVIARDTDDDVKITFSGSQVDVISDSDIRLFGINDERLKEGVSRLLGRRPSDVYLKSPTPWGDLYQSYKWEQVSRVISIKSARVLSMDKKSIVVSSQDFDNESNKTIKVNTAINHSVENTVTSSWSTSSESQISVGMEVKVGFVTGSIGISNSFSHGPSEDKSKSVTIGISTGVEIELEPGQSAIASLSAKAADLEIEVVYTMEIRGTLAMNFGELYNGHHFWGRNIVVIMQKVNIENEKTTVQRLKFGYYSDARLKVFDKLLRSVLWSN